MKDAITRLIDTIEAQKSVYAELLQLTEQETEAVINHKVDQVMTLVSQKEMLIKRLDGIEQQRLSCTQALGDSLGLADRSPRLEILCAALDDHDRSRLQGAGQALAQVVWHLDRANRRNEGLLNHALDLVKGSINTLSPAEKKSDVYHPSGQMTRKEKGGRFVSGDV